MQLQEPTHKLLPAPSTLRDEIESAVENENINPRAADVLLSLHDKDKLLNDPEAIARHAQITHFALQSSAKLGTIKHLH